MDRPWINAGGTVISRCFLSKIKSENKPSLSNIALSNPASSNPSFSYPPSRLLVNLLIFAGTAAKQHS
jgi:hypothetical protein